MYYNIVHQNDIEDIIAKNVANIEKTSGEFTAKLSEFICPYMSAVIIGKRIDWERLDEILYEKYEIIRTRINNGNAGAIHHFERK